MTFIMRVKKYPIAACICDRASMRRTLAMVMVAVASTVQASDFVHQFGRGTLGEPAFVVHGSRDSKQVSAVKDGFRIQSRNQTLSVTGLRTIFSLPKDFEIGLWFKATLSKPESGRRNGVKLALDFRDDPRTRVAIHRACLDDGQQVIEVAVSNQTGIASADSQTFPVPSGFQGFKVIRVAKELKITALLKNDETPLTVLQVPAREVFPVVINAATGSGKAALDVTLQKLEVNGAEFPIEREVPREPWPTWIWMFLVSSSGLLMGGLLMVWQRWRQA